MNNHPFVLCLTHRPVLFSLFLPDSAVSGEIESAAPEHADANNNRGGWGADGASKYHTQSGTVRSAGQRVDLGSG